MATKLELVSTLRARGVTISDSKAKKTPLATLEQMVAELSVDVDQGSPDADVLTEEQCAKAADAWINAKDGRLARYGLAEATSPVHDGKCTITTTYFHLIEVDATTGKAKYLGVSPAREMVVTAKVVPIRAAINREPKPAAAFRPTAPGSKRDHMARLVLRPNGATVEELMEVTGWSRSTTQSAITEDLIRGLGLGMRRVDDRYVGSLPAGITSHVREQKPVLMAANTAARRKPKAKSKK